MRWKMAFLGLGVLAVLAVMVVLFMRLERETPAISFTAEPRFIGGKTPFTFTVEDRKTGLRRIGVLVQQGGKNREILSQEFPSGGLAFGEREHRRTVTATIDYKTLGLEQGPAILIVEAYDNALWGFGKGNRALRQFPVTVDVTPPRIDLLSTAHNVNMGGTGLVVYRTSEDVRSTGVEVGDLFFPGYPERSGGPKAHVAYFVLPYDAPAGVVIRLSATDLAGNVSRRTFPFRILAKRFPQDTIVLTDNFLQAKMPEFSAADPSLGSDPSSSFITVNREWRKRDHRRLQEICSKSLPERLWSDAFIQMKNTQNMANYAESRTYTYRDQVIDQQVHLGLDLASTAGAPVPAANAGEVAMTGDLGIYGQVVLLDHGQGVFSLYAHLSGIAASAGQRVEKGQIIGASGQSGMAGGDHLHFAVLVSGVFTSPLEWLDQHWIDDNIKNKLALFLAPSL